MNIALIGYGKMGKEVENQAIQRGHNVVAKIDTLEILKKTDLSAADIAIDFSFAETEMKNIQFLAEKHINMVVGTTGWHADLDQVKEIVNKHKTGLLYSANFSIGVNLYWKIIEEAVKLMNNFPDYDPMIHEFHHAQKKDSPSGTALKIGQILLKHLKTKNSLVTTPLNRPLSSNEIHISATRGGNIPGTHQVLFDSAADTIELVHTARGRAGFALGAVIAAEWLKGKKGVFTMDEIMKF